MTIVCIASLLLLIFSFFTYYFINSYKSIKVYLINNLQENIKINGLFLTSKEKFYFDLNISGIDVAKTNLLYFDNNEYKSIYSIDDNKIFFEEKYGTNEYFNYKKLNVIENNLYLEIIDNNKKNYNIKLDLKRDFVNDNLLFLKEKNIVNNNYYEKKDIPIKIEEKFNLDDDVYKLNLKENNKNISLYYMVSSRRFGGSITSKNENIDWTYDMDNKIIEYYKFDDKLEKINSFTLTYEDAKNISDEYGSIILNLINKYIYNES